MILDNKKSLLKLLKEVKGKSNVRKAKESLRFVKTNKGEYGENYKFLGITVPESRKIAKKYYNLSFKEVSILLKNRFQEVRLIALLILIYKYNTSNKQKTIEGKKNIYNFYLSQTKYINSWMLVDISAHYIVGNYLLNRDRGILEKLAKSRNLWERRIAIVSTYAFIKNGEYEWTFKLTKMLLNDREDLIHKACGWMLREVGKEVSVVKLKAFLSIYGPKMPRTMLRYAIEKLPEKTRKQYLKS